MRTTIIKSEDGMIIPVIFEQPVEVKKADTELSQEDNQGLGEYQLIYPKTPISILKEIAKESTIIPQCIKAYKTNIAGFGITVSAKDEKIDSPEELTESKALEGVLEGMNYDMPFKDVLQIIIDFREQCGIAYMEIVRSGVGEVVESHSVDPEHITQTTLGSNLEYTSIINGKEVTRKGRFRKFLQQVNNTNIWFKDFGFPKYMDYRTGDITESHNGEFEANELLPFKIGTELYGTPRWWGQVVNVQGSKMAEYVNYNYFMEGRHTPVMIIVKGGTLSDKSWKDLQNYMNDIKGYKNSHGFIILEVEALEQGIQSLSLNDDKGNKIDVEIKDLSPMLQNDALFLEYLNKNEAGIQSSFNLPDIYVGKTKEYNRATAYAAMDVTEKQVFQPERNSFNWIINNILLSEYNFKTVRAELVAPKFNNVDDLFKILTVVDKAGGLTPILAQKLLTKYAADLEIKEYDSEWGDMPIEVLRILQQQTNSLTASETIEKSEDNVGYIDVLKDVRNALDALVDKYNLE